MSTATTSLVGQLNTALESVIRLCGDTNGDVMAQTRIEFDKLRGPVFADEDLWEIRTRSFLQWFVIERRDRQTATTPLERAIKDCQEDDDRLELLEAWRRSYRCLIEINDISSGQTSVVDLLGDAHIVVDELRRLPGVSIGDIAECRLVTHGERIHFGGWFLWHPSATRVPLLAQIEAAKTEGLEREPILDRLSSLLVRSLRYSHVPVAKVYAQPL